MGEKYLQKKMSEGTNINSQSKTYYKNGFGSEKATKQYHESIQQGPAVAHQSIWSPNQMVSMSDLVTEGDDDLMAEFFTYDETPSPVTYQQPLQHEPLKKQNMTTSADNGGAHQESNTDDNTSDGQGSSKLQQKLKEVDTFVQNYSGSSAPRPDPIWNKTDMVSMDDLIAFDQDLGEELEAENNNEQEELVQPIPIPEAKPQVQEQRTTRQPKLAPKEKRSKVLDAGFDANEALSMLINIQSSQDDKKFDLLDGFLDKYKISQPNKKSTIVEESFFFANNSKREQKTATQIFEQVIAPGRSKSTTRVSEPEVSPFCVRRESRDSSSNDGLQPPARQATTFKSNGYTTEQTSFTTFDAIQNVQVREPSSNQSNKRSLDNLIPSNRASNNDMKKDHLYWERRRINNEAAHRSRAKRKRLIEEKTSKIDYYESENPKLRQKLSGILDELAALKRKLVYFQKLEAGGQFQKIEQ